jgi:hypothetical protein
LNKLHRLLELRQRNDRREISPSGSPSSCARRYLEQRPATPPVYHFSGCRSRVHCIQPIGAESIAIAQRSVVTTKSQLKFSNDRSEATIAVESVASGKGWCTVVPFVTEEAKDLSMSVFGLWVSSGVTVASFVTAPPHQGIASPSSLGLLHTRGRLGREKISALLNGAPFKVRQDHNQRGLLLDVPSATPAAQVLDVMCTLTSELCDFELTGAWRLDLFTRD